VEAQEDFREQQLDLRTEQLLLDENGMIQAVMTPVDGRMELKSEERWHNRQARGF
jgi:hypothetical protein